LENLCDGFALLRFAGFAHFSMRRGQPARTTTTMTSPECTPVSIITGFLGSGKTTLLNRLLQHPGMANAAVIINEFGEIGLDHLLIATPSENTVLLSTGCLCCTMRGDLVDTLADLYFKRRDRAIPSFDKVVVETTGLADPVPIIQTVVTDPDLAPLFRLDSVVTLVDGVNGAAQLDQHPEAVKQAAIADRMVISKTDLAQPDATEALRQRLARINPGARIVTAVHGAIAPHELFGAALEGTHAASRNVASWLRADAFPHAEAHHDHPAPDVNRHDDHIRAFCLYHDEPVSAAGLMMWLSMLGTLRGANLLRVKGLLNVDGRPVAVHAVQSLIHEPVTLDDWPDDERRSRLVFITRDMARSEVEKTLAALRLQANARQRAQTIDPEAYARFLDAAKNFR
jgi:G3E family GTPase